MRGKERREEKKRVERMRGEKREWKERPNRHELSSKYRRFKEPHKPIFVNQNQRGGGGKNGVSSHLWKGRRGNCKPCNMHFRILSICRIIQSNLHVQYTNRAKRKEVNEMVRKHNVIL